MILKLTFLFLTLYSCSRVDCDYSREHSLKAEIEALHDSISTLNIDREKLELIMAGCSQLDAVLSSAGGFEVGQTCTLIYQYGASLQGYERSFHARQMDRLANSFINGSLDDSVTQVKMNGDYRGR